MLNNNSPAHYLVMENMLKDMDPDKGWKKWDLKPQQFFEVAVNSQLLYATELIVNISLYET